MNNLTNNISVGITIKRLRKQKGWTQKELAERTQLQRTYISSIETGEKNITISTLEKILKAFNISFQSYFLLADKEKNNFEGESYLYLEPFNLDDSTYWLGKKIKFYRLNLNISQEELAYEAGIATSYASKIENGSANLTVNLLYSISSILNIHISKLFNH
ncbi:helix-turn-helix domain-containing protein [Alkalibacterium sp. AK22]|uniref:helix-turn-helix domain-containing protein n=1 Tax=Alkalibacterium sp. AK22 TaxID=1229520 RepID=UPI0009E079E4|nr:helix-turn-helix transcriptional regulator [Alkalibacterium sp. AK22]